MSVVISAIARTALIFILTLIVFRLIGRNRASRPTFFDLIGAVIIAETAAATSMKLVSLPIGLTVLVAWALLSIAVAYLSLKSKRVRDLVQGKEIVLINHGKVLDDKLFEARMSPEDLLSHMRHKNVFKFADVEFATLEPDGEVALLLNNDNQPLTPKTVGLQVGRESVPQTIILDGTIMDEPLTAMGLNRNWLMTEIGKIGVAHENIFLAQVDSFGQLYLDLYDDNIQLPQPKTKELAFATLKKTQADCELYSLQTRNQAAKAMYQNAAASLQTTIEELEPILIR